MNAASILDSMNKLTLEELARVIEDGENQPEQLATSLFGDGGPKNRMLAKEYAKIARHTLEFRLYRQVNLSPVLIKIVSRDIVEYTSMFNDDVGGK